MKVLHINKSDAKGGAARAAYRLHKSLIDRGVDSQMLVLNKRGDDPTVIGARSKLARGWSEIRPTLDMLPLELYRQRDRVPYSPHWLPSRIDRLVESYNPDLVNLHWIGGYFPVETLAKFKRPIVWTLHDMWAFTGGCHYTQQCDRFLNSCGRCPILQSDRDYDLSRWLWQRKAKAWQGIDLNIVTPSRWLAKCAQASSLLKDFPVRAIANGLNIHQYKPVNRRQARDWLGLPQDKQIILFGALSAVSDRRKGFHLLLPALQKLQHYYPAQIELVVFGSSQPSTPPDFGFKAHYLGQLHDDISLALVYAAADVFVAASVQDNLPNTVVEALACGTPCAAFNIGGIPDIIDHQQNGYLAEAYDTGDLARGIAWILEDMTRWQNLTLSAVAKVKQEFTVEQQAESYHQLYQDLVN